MAKVVIYVEGGNVQGAITDSPGVELLIVDYDNEDAGQVRDPRFEPVEVNPQKVADAMACRE
jgi:hypothetical protein